MKLFNKTFLKSFLTIIFIILLIFTSCSKKPKKIELPGDISILPENTMFFAQFSNTQNFYNNFIKTNFYSKMINIIQNNPYFSKKIINPKLQNFFDSKDIHEEIFKIIGQEILFFSTYNDNKFNIGLIVTGTDKKNTQKYYNKLISKLIKTKKKLNYQRKNYKKIFFDSIQIENTNPNKYNKIKKIDFTFFNYKNKFFITNTFELAVQIADKLISNSKSNFQNNDIIQKTFRKINYRDNLLFYFEPETLSKFLQESDNFKNIPLIETVVNTYNTIKAISGSIKLDKNSELQIFSLINDQASDKELIKFYKRPSRTLKSLYFIPVNTIFSIVIQRFDSNFIISRLKQILAKSKEDKKLSSATKQAEDNYDKLKKYVKDNIKLDLEKDILGNIDREIAFSLINFNNGIVPVPEISVAWKVKNQDKMKKFINNSLDLISKNLKQDLNIIEMDYNDDKMYSVLVPGLLAGVIRPTYVFKDDYFILSNNTNTLKNILNVKNKKKQAPKNITFSPDIEPIKNNVINSDEFMRLDFKKFIEQLKDMALTYREYYEQFDITYKNDVFPVLQLLSSLKTITYFEKFEDNGIKLKLNAHFEDINK